MQVDVEEHCDTLVIGAGSSGCVVAARLSEKPDHRVVLLEAGPAYAENDKPAPLRSARAAVVRGCHWPFDASVHSDNPATLGREMKRAAGVFAAASGRLGMMRASVQSVLAGGNPVSRFSYPMPRVTGGGSAVNGALAMVPPAADFERWAAPGDARWRWDEMRRWFEMLLDGNGRPVVPIETTSADAFTPIQRAFRDACRAEGFPDADADAPEAIGISGIPRNVEGERRLSCDELYLRPALGRSNFVFRSNATVERILFENDAANAGQLRACGVLVRIGASVQRVSARRIVLCAGAINSPALLQRSGIGPREWLEAAGIPVRLHAPAVGANLVDHPAVCLWAVPHAGACSTDEPVHQALLRTGDDGLQLYMLGATSTERFPPLREVSASDVAVGVSIMLGRPRSRGRVAVKSADPDAAPSIELNLLADAGDMALAMRGARLAWRLLKQPQMRERIDRIVMWNQDVVDTDRQLETLVYTTVRSSMHPTGTLRMGGENDATAATDFTGALRGVSDLIVADASIMPEITTVPTNLTCIAIAERIADGLRT